MAALSVLVAEDREEDVDLLKVAAFRTGLHVQFHFVSNGKEAIDYLKGAHTFANRTENPMPTILLLDVKMPGLGGFDVLEWLRLQPGLRRLVVIVLTSSDNEHDVIRAYELGANSYLVKPSDIAKLEEMARSLDNYWLNLNLCPRCEAQPRAPQPATRVILRNVDTGKYYSGPQNWTDHSTRALDFERRKLVLASADRRTHLG